MRYLILIVPILMSIYPFSYARYNILKKNYFGGVGMILLTLASIAVPAWLIMKR